MGRKYVLPFGPTAALTTTVPFVQIATPATMQVAITGIELGQTANETSVQEVLTITRRSTASTLPTAQAPLRLNDSDAASLLTGTTTTNAWGIATVTGTIGDVLRRVTFNQLNGWLWVPTPEQYIILGISEFVTIQFETAPASALWAGTINLEELS